MRDLAIQAVELSKRYRLGQRLEESATLAGTLARWVSSPIRNFRRLRQLTHFGDSESNDLIWALQSVSFEVREGEVVGVIGRNGAGKSTLLKILSRITEPTAGRVQLAGRVGSLLEVGTGFHPELTGRENIYLNGTLLGMSQAEVRKRFDEIVCFSGVEKFIDTPIKRYSSGMKVRLAFSVAAHLESEILIIDEVLAVGDMEFQQKCLGKMDAAARKGRTVLFVSHNMAAVESLCSRAIVLEGGRIIEDCETNRAVRAYYDLCTDAQGSAWLDLDPAELARQGRARIAHVTVTAPDQIRPGHFLCGSRLEFRVVCWFPSAGCKPELGVGINNRQGVRLLTLHTRVSPGAIETIRKPGWYQFTCGVDRLNLAPNQFYLRARLSDSWTGEVLDIMDHAAPFALLESAQSPTVTAGVLLHEHKWAVKEVEPDFQNHVQANTL